MRVAYICADPGVPVFGTKGASVHVQEIVRAWRRQAEVTVYCTRRGAEPPPDLADLAVIEAAPVPGHGNRREQATVDASLTLADRILHDGCSLVYERYSLFSPALSVVARLLDVPSILEVNAPLIEEQQRYRDLISVQAAESILRRNAGTADVTACVSKPVARWVRSRVPAARTITAPNGVNTERITPRSGAPRDEDQLTVAFVGTLKPWHGVPLLLEAVALANAARPDGRRRWSVRLIGDGPERGALEQLAASLNLVIEFTGAVPPANVSALLTSCHVAAAPYPDPGSRREDYFSPLKIYEYMAAGMPIIATSVPSVRSILDNGHTAVLVPPGEPEAFAAALNRLGENPRQRQQLGANARREAVTHHDWARVLARITSALPARTSTSQEAMQ